MSRLKGLSAPVAPLASRLYAFGVDGERSIARDAAWRKWYATKRWRDLRMEVLTAAGFTCSLCRRIELNLRELVADHKRAHRGDPRLFWDRDNLQCLCKRCHDGAKQRQEARESRR